MKVCPFFLCKRVIFGRKRSGVICDALSVMPSQTRSRALWRVFIEKMSICPVCVLGSMSSNIYSATFDNRGRVYVALYGVISYAIYGVLFAQFASLPALVFGLKNSISFFYLAVFCDFLPGSSIITQADPMHPVCSSARNLT